MESNEGSVCPLCRHDKIKIYAVGECSHPVCHLCSTKMRILCEQTYCAICRQELPQVYFVSDLAITHPTIDQSRFTPIDETGDCGIYYPIKAEWIRRETEKLLRNFCPFCYSEYETFDILRDHVRRTHRYFYCDLCVENLNLFPHERKCYTRHDLVQHIRCGDRDDTSFKGHPLCRFCDDHFLDVDQLYKHMRKEHYYCHLCTDDNVYYSDFDLLRDHYRSSHYFCEIGQCKDVQFTNVFSSEIDFRAHQATQHSKNRAEARQLGTIPVEFQLTGMRDRKQQRDPAHRGTFKSGEFKTQGNNNSSRNERDDIQQEPAVAVAVPSIDEFPTLGERSSTPQNVSQHRGAWLTDSFRRIHSSDDFPTLASAANNVSNMNVSQTKGIWREQQQIMSSSSTNLNVTSKKAPQPVKPLTNGTPSVNLKEDFPALKGASNAKIPAPVSMFSAWSTAKKSAKNANANAKANQPQMRLNTNRLINDDENDEYIRRPMASLTTSTTPIASSNIKMISSSDLPSTQTNEKQNKNKKQSLPNSQDFPALPSTTTTQNNVVSSNVWVTDGTNPSTKLSTKQQKKKSAALSKKKFMEEVQAMPPPLSLSSTNDFPTIGLSQLGQRLITDENQPTLTAQTKEEKPPLPLPPSSTTSSSSIKQEKKDENKSTVQSNKIAPKATKKNDSIKQEASSQPLIQDESVSQVAPPPTSSIQSPPTFATSVVVPPPPGFTTPLVIPPPPGFNAISSSQSAAPSYIFTSSHPRQKDEFRTKLFNLFDSDMNLFNEYDKFCEAFSQNKITSQDFMTYTTQLFKGKIDEYLPELIVIMPNIEQQNELYSNWKKNIQSTSSSTAAATQNKTTWTKKNSDEKNIHICRICRQIMFESDVDEHNSYHTEFNTQFPSLPIASVPIGRGRGKTKK
ncbi:unnamed protein product [Rotaria sp. Silwood1]|nr:unnamed protein product [Rotaria sp. Silwood1]CAF0783991.1 unnamed protein product [Rotaria sp. Silwood1]CAF3323161.1 unnamed protein product [Rotaria sp. Silwood1]CAF4588155.1 unnamed protein product [Rotaria sp. Silwood1]